MVKYCQECEAPVSNQFARVLGSRDDEVHACPYCSSSRQIFDGAAAGIQT